MKYASLNGAQVNIDNIDRGKICECLACGKEVIAKKGISRSFFSHAKGGSNKDCTLFIGKNNLIKLRDEDVASTNDDSLFSDLYSNKFNNDVEDISGITEEQLAIVNSKSKRIIVNAISGSGKTFTAEEYIKITSNKKILYVVYNSSMAKEARKRFKGLKNVEVRTIHSLAYGAFGHKYQHRLTGDLGIFDIAKAVGIFARTPEQFAHVDLLKETLTYYLTSRYDTVDDLCDKFKLSYDIKSDLRTLFEKSKKLVSKNESSFKDKKKEELKVTHDFYLKLWCLSEPSLINYDVLIIDEAQDISGSFLKVVENLKVDKIIAIGDNHQSIYGFTNAVNAFDVLSDGWDRYELTKSFRVGNTLATLVENMMSGMLCEDFVFKGYNKDQMIVRKIDENKKHMVLCRCNATILKNVILSALKGKKCYIEGGSARVDFSFIEKIFDFKYDINKHYTLKKFKNYEHMLNLARKNKDYNIILCDKLIEEYGYNLGSMLKKAKSCMVEKLKDADVGYSTAHKMKGSTITIPMKLADDFPDLDEIDIDNEIAELNLIYVALTRAKGEIEIPVDVLNYFKRVFEDKRKIEHNFNRIICHEIRDIKNSVL